MKSHMTGGVGATNVTYYETITVQIPIMNADGTITALSFDTHAGFTAGMEAQGIGLLGQAGFFEHFSVQFNHKARIFSIEA
jgi:hypothetical protein